MAFYQILHLCVQSGKDFLVRGDESRLGAIASCQVLRGNNGNRISCIGTNKKYLAVIYGVLDRMDYADSWVYDEYPDQMSLLRLVETILRLIPEKTNMTRENQRNLLQILLYDEILRRRQMNGRQQGGRNIFGLSMDGKQFKLD